MSVAPEELVRDLGIQINKESTRVYSLENASDEPMEVVGMASLWIKHPEATGPVEVTFLVISDMTGPEFLLGWQDMKTMGMLPENFPGLINQQQVVDVK